MLVGWQRLMTVQRAIFFLFFAFESWAGEDLSLKIDKLDQAISKCDLEYKMI